MGTVLSIDEYKESKRDTIAGHTEINSETGLAPRNLSTVPAADMMTGREMLHFHRLANEMGPYLPFALQQVYNLLVFKKVPPVGPMVEFEVSTDPNAPTMIPVEWSRELADVSGSYTLLPALAGRTICIELDDEKYYVCLSIKPGGGVCEKA